MNTHQPRLIRIIGSFLIGGVCAATIAAAPTDGSDAADMPPPPRRQTADAERPAPPELTEAQKRRYEIMVLLQAYRILPEAQKTALKPEIMKRLREDYQANRHNVERTIARLEKELAMLKAGLDEKNADVLIEHEFERLLAAPIGGMGPGGWLPPPNHKRPERSERRDGPERPERPECSDGPERQDGPECPESHRASPPDAPAPRPPCAPDKLAD